MTEPFCEEYANNKEIACNECMKNNYLLQIFFFIGFVPVTLLFSSWIVAKYVFLPYVDKVKNEKDIEWPEEEEVIAYENKYEIKIKNQKNDEINYEKCSVCESTPDGLVFMRYNKENEGFDWWSDNKSVKYIYLETVSRKYVNVFSCSSLYIDRKEDLKRQLEIEKEKEEREKMEIEDNKDEVDSDDDLFVKLKPNKKIKPTKKDKQAAINGNKFKYCGKIKDFKLLQKRKKNSAVKKKIDFSSWKSMMNM